MRLLKTWGQVNIQEDVEQIEEERKPGQSNGFLISPRMVDEGRGGSRKDC
jgi:hypothetical protein